MIVVCNTSPLTSLAAIGQFELLRELFGRIHIAQGVWHELNHGGRPHPGSREVENASWIDRHEVQNRVLVKILHRDLDRGEAETLALGIELKADLVLLDEQEGRHAASRLGVRSLGVLGMLLQATPARWQGWFIWMPAIPTHTMIARGEIGPSTRLTFKGSWNSCNAERVRKTGAR